MGIICNIKRERKIKKTTHDMLKHYYVELVFSCCELSFEILD